MVAVHESRAWPKHRELERSQSPWPAGTTIVSADSHVLKAFDWPDYVPAKYRDRAPTSHWDDTGFHLSADGRSLDSQGFPSEMMMGRPGARDVHLRIKDMDAEGISKDVLFPQLCYGLIGNDDRDFVSACFRGYNELVMDHVKPYRDRLFPVGLIPFWDEASVREGGAQLKDLGFKAMIMPTVPPGVSYNSREHEGLWDAVEEIGLPLSFHVGENFQDCGPGGLATTVVVAFGGFRYLWSLLTFPGILERHPTLRVVFTEGGIGWIPSCLFDADKVYTAFESEMTPRLAHPPSYYWFNNCYATFMDDQPGLEQLHRIGADRVMWTYDYPHPEGTLGYTQESLQVCFDAAATVSDGQRIVGQNAIDLWGLDDSQPA